MITYKVSDEVLQGIRDHLNSLLSLGIVPGYCMEIVDGHDTHTHKLKIYDTGNYNFQVKIIKK